MRTWLRCVACTAALFTSTLLLAGPTGAEDIRKKELKEIETIVNTISQQIRPAATTDVDRQNLKSAGMQIGRLAESLDQVRGALTVKLRDPFPERIAETEARRSDLGGVLKLILHLRTTTNEADAAKLRSDINKLLSDKFRMRRRLGSDSKQELDELDQSLVKRLQVENERLKALSDLHAKFQETIARSALVTEAAYAGKFNITPGTVEIVFRIPESDSPMRMKAGADLSGEFQFTIAGTTVKGTMSWGEGDSRHTAVLEGAYDPAKRSVDLKVVKVSTPTKTYPDKIVRNAFKITGKLSGENDSAATGAWTLQVRLQPPLTMDEKGTSLEQIVGEGSWKGTKK